MSTTPSGASLLKQKEIAYSKKASWESLWQVCLDYADPSHDGITTMRTKGANVSNTRLIDICMRSNITYTSGLYAYLCSGDWLSFSSGKRSDKGLPELVKWWNEASYTIFEAFNTSNFKDEITQYFKSLGSIGTSCMLTEYTADKLVFKFFDIAEYAILEDNNRRVDSVFRNLVFSAKQAIQEFGYDKVSLKVRKAFEDNTDDEFHYTHVVQPRINRKKKSEASKDMPYASYYVEEDSKKIIKEGGFDTFPFAVCRINKSRKEVYGRPPMSDCIATANMLQYYEETFIAISDKKSHPNWLVDKQSRVEGLTNAKDGITYFDSRRSGAPPQRLIENIDTNFTSDDILKKEKDIEESFFVPLFDALKDHRNMTATETQERVSSSISRIAPIVSRILSEGLSQMAERAFMIMLKEGLLPAIPKGYEANFTNVQANFYGRLSQLTEELELENMQRGVNAVMQYAEFKPEMLDWVDGDELAQKILLNSNTPSSVINSKIKVDEKRAAAAKARQQQESMVAMNAMADGISKTGAKPEEGSPAQKLMETM